MLNFQIYLLGEFNANCPSVEIPLGVLNMVINKMVTYCKMSSVTNLSYLHEELFLINLILLLLVPIAMQ